MKSPLKFKHSKSLKREIFASVGLPLKVENSDFTFRSHFSEAILQQQQQQRQRQQQLGGGGTEKASRAAVVAGVTLQWSIYNVAKVLARKNYAGVI